jgi:phosphatidate cytidylyltransferase
VDEDEERGSEERGGRTERVRIIGADEAARVELPHWTETPTGEVPAALAAAEPDVEDEEADDLASWSALPGRGASFRSARSDWEDDGFDPALLADEGARLGALADPDEGDGEETGEDSFDEGLFEEEPIRVGTGRREGETRLGGRGALRRRERRERRDPARATGTGRALVTGLGAGALTAVAFALGSLAALAFVTAVATLAAAELFGVLRRAGYRPATLVGLVATAGLMVATYESGEAAYPVVAVLAVVATLLWYLFGVVRARPTVNVAVTLLGIGWVGVLSSFAGLLLDPRLFPHRHGVAFLFGAIATAVAYDIGAYAVGRRFGRHALAPSVSPAKTWEGLLGGTVVAIVVAAVLVSRLHPFTVTRGLGLGLVVSVAAPLGDLCESMLKRDLGLKDMGRLLPGHGGVLDRVDALLFVLPATFYLLRLFNVA